jgi:hypothetical protein
MAANDPNSARPKRIARWTAAFIGAVILIGVFTAIAISPVPMRGAELFGALANKIKGNPGATALVVFTALGLLWLGIGLFAAIQEWLAARRRAS